MPPQRSFESGVPKEDLGNEDKPVFNSNAVPSLTLRVEMNHATHCWASQQWHTFNDVFRSQKIVLESG